MRATVKNISGCCRRIDIEVSTSELAKNFDQVYAEIGRTSRIPGFRPGKAPRDLLQVHYGKKAEEEVLKRAITEYYLKALQQEHLTPVVYPQIEDVQYKNQHLSFSAKVDVKPEVKLKEYKQLSIKKKKINIEQAQVEQRLEKLRQMRANGKDDAAFLREVGFKSLDELKAALRQNLSAQAEEQIQIDLQRQLLEELLKKASFDLPESLVVSQTEEVFNQIKFNQTLQGAKKEEIDAQEKKLRELAKKEAEHRVRVFFILDKIAELEGIYVEEKDLEEKIAQIAQRSGKSVEETKQYLTQQKLLPELKTGLRDGKTIRFLMQQAKVEEDISAK